MTIRVLLVEPDPTIVQPISQQLHHLNCLVSGQGELAIALEQVQTTPPELVILNLSLQGSLEIVPQLPCPVIYIVPPTIDEATLTLAEATNPWGYLFTPINPMHLRLSLQSVFRLHTQPQPRQVQPTETILKHLVEGTAATVGEDFFPL